MVKSILSLKTAIKEQLKPIVFVVGRQEFHNNMVQQSTREKYEKAYNILGKQGQPIPENLPKNQQELITLLLEGTELAERVEFVEPNYVDKWAANHGGANSYVCSTHPQLQTHILTYARLFGKNCNVVGGVATESEEANKLYDTQSASEKHTFELNNLARILYKVQELKNS